jgi:hypothetical protein
MGVVIGVMIGYALGCRAGPEGWTEVEEAWHTISTSKEVRDFAEGALAIGRDLLLGAPDEASRLRPVA